MRQPQTRRRQDVTSNQQVGDDGWVELDDDTQLVVIGDDVEEGAEDVEDDVEDFQ